MIIVLMGVSGSGKTTIGKVLAHQLGWTFLDADDYHPAANVEKIVQGVGFVKNQTGTLRIEVHEPPQSLTVGDCSRLGRVR
jgi:gluconokinase